MTIQYVGQNNHLFYHNIEGLQYFSSLTDFLAMHTTKLMPAGTHWD